LDELNGNEMRRKFPGIIVKRWTDSIVADATQKRLALPLWVGTHGYSQTPLPQQESKTVIKSPAKDLFHRISRAFISLRYTCVRSIALCGYSVRLRDEGIFSSQSEVISVTEQWRLFRRRVATW
jgi:hypothetical protein